MLIGSVLQIYPFDFKPSAPDAGSFILYAKTDNIVYLQDSSGTEYPFASSSIITSLTGDVTATGPGAAVATVQFVGGQTAAAIAAATVTVDAATSSNVASTLVERDPAGNFAAGTITASLIGNVSGSATSFTGSLSGDVTGTQSATTIASTVVTGKLLTGYTTGTNTPILSTDSILIALEKLQAQISGSVGSAITSLTGDVSATGPGAATATVNFVGGQTATAVAFAATQVAAATSSNTASTLVLRDASGNFSAGIITAALNGNATTSTTSTNFTGSLSGDVTGTQSATVVSLVGGQTAAAVAAATVTVDAATSANTASTLVERDASGNFSANIITAALVGNVTGNVSGSATSFTGSLSGDVTGTQSATTIASTVVTGKLLTGYTTGTNTPILSTDSILIALEKLQAQITFTIGGAITALTGDVTATGPGSAAATVAKIQGTTVSGTTGTGNVVFSASPTLTGTLTAAAISASSLTDTSLTAGSVLFAGAGGLITQDNANFFWNDTSFSLGLGTNVPGSNTIIDAINANGAAKSIRITGYGTGSSVGLKGQFARGTLLSPTPAQSGDLLNFFSGTGYGTSFPASTGVINIVAGETFSGTSNATYLQFEVTPTGSVTKAEKMRLNSTGNLLLGTTTDAGELLQVNGTALFSNTVTDSVAPIFSSLTGYLYGNGASAVTASTTIPGSAITGNISGNSAGFTGSLSGDVTGTQSATVVSKIQGNTVSGTTGTTNVVFSASPTLTGTLTAAIANFSGAVAINDSATNALTINSTSFIFDSVNNALGIGIQPSTAVMIDGVNTSLASKLVQMTGYGVGSTTGYRGRFARGTIGSPSAVQSGDTLSAISGRGYGTSQFATTSTGVINIVAGETFTNTSNLTYLQFSTTPTGSVTSAESMRVATTGVTLGPQSASTAIHQINGGMNFTTRTITAATFTIDTTTTDDIIYTDSTSNAITITLPAATNGRKLFIQDKTGQAATNHITLTPPGAVTINGVNASLLLGVNYGGWLLISDGTNWVASRLSQLPTVQAVSGTVIDWCTVGVAGGLFTKTLSANTTFTFSNATPGQTIVIRLTNTASNYTVTWPTTRWPSAIAPTMSTGAVSDVYTFVYDGSNYYASYVQAMA